MRVAIHFKVELSGSRLDHFLVEKTGETRAFLKTQLEKGHLYLNGRPVKKAGLKLKTGDEITGELEPTPPLSVEPIPGPLNILFEDDHLIALNKTQGIAVHPAPTLTGPTLVHHLLFHLRKTNFAALDDLRPGIVHRLDVGTSGVILIAKNRTAHLNLSEQFQNRTIKKIYEALVWGEISTSGRQETPIGRDRRDRKKMSRHTDKGREASTQWERIAYKEPISHVRVFPLTGRTHQIRVHLTEAGYPLVKDPLYIKRSAYGLRNKLSPQLKLWLSTQLHPFLHAAEINFRHPESDKLISLKAELPNNFKTLLGRL